MGSVVVFEDFTVEPTWEGDFVTAWQELAYNSLEAPGRGRIWWLLEDPERPGRLIGITEWESTDALQRWASVPHTRMRSTPFEI